MSLTPFAPFGPDVIEDECGDEESEKDSNDTIADVIEICIRRIPLKNAVEKSEYDLQPSVTDPFASERRGLSAPSALSSLELEFVDP